MIIGIISYLPDEPGVRSKRLEAHKKQINILKSYNIPIYVVAQNYKEEEYDNSINYVYKGAPLGPSGARNYLLKQFYNTNNDFMWLLDDDIYPYDYYDLDMFIKDIHFNPDKFMSVDFIRPILAFQVPFKKTVYEEPKNTNYYVFKDQNTIGTTCCCIIKNLKKHYNKQLYYDTMNVECGEGYEDKDFCFKLKQNGIKTHKLQTFICGSYNYTDNSTLFKSYEDRMKVHESNNSHILDKYKDMIDDRNILLKKYRDKDVYIKRVKPLKLTSNLKPQDVTKGTLF